MVKTTKAFTIEVSLWEAIKKKVPNMSKFVEDAIRKELAQTENIKLSEEIDSIKHTDKFKLAMKKIKNIPGDEVAEYWVNKLNDTFGTNITVEQIREYLKYA